MGRSTVPSIESLAEQLGGVISASSLERLGVQRVGSWWEWPERDGAGAIIGYGRRADDGTKRSQPGGRRGLVYADPLRQAGSSSANPILLVEGLTDTASAITAGFDAVGRPSAAVGNEHLAELLDDSRHVCIIGENDAGAGRLGAEKCAKALVGKVASIRIVYPPDGVKDLRAWLNADGVEGLREALSRRIASAESIVVQRAPPPLNGKARRPIVKRLCDIEPETIQWEWPGVLVRGGLNGIVGDPGQGKSLCTIDLAARVSTGSGWPDNPTQPFAPGGVLFATAEDALASVVRPRLDAAGADRARVHALDAVAVRGEDGTPIELAYELSDHQILEAAIDETPECRLVIIDPVSAFMGAADSNSNSEMRALLRPLAKMAERRNLCIVLVSHLRKSEGRALHRALGSIGFMAACRVAWGITRDDQDDDEHRRIMVPLKNNYAPDRRGLAFRIVPPSAGQHPSLAWEPGRIIVDADSLMNGGKGRPGPHPEEHDRACHWLRATPLDGPRPMRELVSEADVREGISKRTLDRAKKTLGVLSFQPDKPKGPWMWRLAQ